jgi:hypothetical protein
MIVFLSLSLSQLNSSDRALLNAFHEISQMADRLQLPKMIAVRLFFSSAV